jgi:hypothetical protein
MLRVMLYEAAQILLMRSTKWSWLKAWAMPLPRLIPTAEPTQTRPYRRAENRRLVHGGTNRDRPDDHPHDAA